MTMHKTSKRRKQGIVMSTMNHEPPLKKECRACQGEGKTTRRNTEWPYISRQTCTKCQGLGHVFTATGPESKL